MWMGSNLLWIDNFGFVYSGDGKRLLKGTNVNGAYWIPEGVEEIESGALLGCRIDTLHIPWTAHVHISGRKTIPVAMNRRMLLRMMESIAWMKMI